MWLGVCIMKIPGSDLSLETGYTEVLLGFAQSLQVDAGIVGLP